MLKKRRFLLSEKFVANRRKKRKKRFDISTTSNRT